MRFTTPNIDMLQEELHAFQQVTGRKAEQVQVSRRAMDGIRLELTRLYDAPGADKARLGDTILLLDATITVTYQDGFVMVAS